MSTLRPLLAEVGAVKQYGSIEPRTPTSKSGSGNFLTVPGSQGPPRPRKIRAPPRIPLMVREIWDENMRKGTDWAFVNACYGIFIMILLNEIPDRLPQWAVLAMQTSMTVTTCLLLYQLFSLKYYQRRIRLAELVTKRRKVLPIHKQAKDEKSVAAKYPLPHLHKWALLKQTCLEPEFWLSNIIYAIHLPPALWIAVPPQVGLFMFLRLWLVFDVLRLHSNVYKQRHINKTLLPDTRIIYSRGVSLRTFIYDRPISFALLSVAGSITIFGYCVHVLERADETYTFFAALWVSAEAVLFMWPADVYEDDNPRTWTGRFVCIIASLVGLAITAFCVGATFDQILSTPQEKKLVLWIRYASVRKQEVDRAARLIQYVMRTYLHEEKLKKQYEDSDPEKLERLLDAIDDEWYDIVALHSSDLRRLRMDRIDLEVEWRKYSLEPMPVWQLDIFSSMPPEPKMYGKAQPDPPSRESEAEPPATPIVEHTENKTDEESATKKNPYVSPDHYRERDVVTKLNTLQARMDDLASEMRGISLALTGRTSVGGGSSSGGRSSSGGGGSSSSGGSGPYRGSCSVVSRRTVEPTRRAATPRSSDYTSSGNYAKHWDTGYYSSS